MLSPVSAPGRERVTLAELPTRAAQVGGNGEVTGQTPSPEVQTMPDAAARNFDTDGRRVQITTGKVDGTDVVIDYATLTPVHPKPPTLETSQSTYKSRVASEAYKASKK